MKIGIVVRPNNKLGDILTGKLKLLKYNSIHEFIFFDVNEKIEDIYLDFIMVFGGDGTILSVARNAPSIPILPFNIGNLGFLTELYFDINNLQWYIDKFEKGEYTIDKRKRLNALHYRQGFSPNENITALNDIIIKGSVAKLIRLETYIDNVFVAEFPADGLIISTATGSTAYSLSAGGPIIQPHIPINVITPICSHMLNVRSIITTDEQEIKIKVNSFHDGVILSIDGQLDFPLYNEDEIIIKKSKYTTNFIRIGEYKFFDTLYEKMGWGK